MQQRGLRRGAVTCSSVRDGERSIGGLTAAVVVLIRRRERRSADAEDWKEEVGTCRTTQVVEEEKIGNRLIQARKEASSVRSLCVHVGRVYVDEATATRRLLAPSAGTGLRQRLYLQYPACVSLRVDGGTTNSSPSAQLLACLSKKLVPCLPDVSVE